MTKVASPSLNVTIAGVEFPSPIGVGAIGFPWGKGMPHEPELHAEVLLKHVKAGAGYINLTAGYLTEETVHRIKERARIEAKHFMPAHGMASRMIKVVNPEPPHQMEGMFYIDSPFLLTTEMALSGAENTEKLVKILMENKPQEVPLIGSTPGFGDFPESWADGARKWEELGASMIELNVSCPVPATVGGAVDDYFEQRFPARFQGAIIGDQPELVEAIVREVVKAVRIPVGVKMTPETGYPRVIGLARKVRDAGGRFVHTFNSAVGIAPPDIYNGGRPLIPFSDGNPFCMASGPYLRFPCYRNIAAIGRFVPELDIAAAGGLERPEHFVEAMMLGATLAQPCTAIIEQGRSLIRRGNDFLKKFMVEQGYRSAQELIGLGQQYIKYNEDLDLMGGRVIARLDPTKCTKCGRCLDNICTAIYSEKGKIGVREERCGGCGGCTIACPVGAISLVLKD